MSFYGAPHNRSTAASERARRGVRSRAQRYPNWRRPDAEDYRVFQHQAHLYVRAAIKCGVLPDLSLGEYACVDCGAAATQYEHRDYRHPLDVEPVCKACNLKRGRGQWPSDADYCFKKVKD